MIINLDKFQSVKDFKVDFTDGRPGIYFLLNINEKTKRYIKSGNEYFENKYGNYVIDHGMDITERIPRVLRYIGESTIPIIRLTDHYFVGQRIDNGQFKKGIGPVFTHIRVIKGFKRFEYDTVRLHHERLLVRKYLPELNQASQLTDNQKIIILNSEGKVTPYDLLKPYLLHARDLFKAYQAWEKEDMKYIEENFIPYKLERPSTGLIHPNKRDPRLYRDKDGNKKGFGSWVNDCVLLYHKKQVAAIKIWSSNRKKFIRLYDPDRYEKNKIKNKQYNKQHYLKNREFNLINAKLYKKLKKQKNQPGLL